MRKNIFFAFISLFKTWRIPKTSFAMGSLSLVFFSGCMPNLPTPDINMTTRYPFVVESELVTQRVKFQGSKLALDKVEIVRVNSFLTSFLRDSGGVLEIRIPAALDDAKAESRLRVLLNYINKRGTPTEDVHVSQIPGGHGNDDLMILSYNKFAVETIKCDRRNTRTAYNPSNLPHPDLGCSSRSNIAAMVANPADLERPQTMQPSDPTRRVRVIKKYRAGEATEATRGPGESASSIRSLGSSSSN